MLDFLTYNCLNKCEKGRLTVSRDFRGQATVKVKGRKENLTVSRPFSHLFKQM